MDPISRTPTKPVDYATLTAGYGALLGALLVASRDNGERPIAEAELPAIALATFALSKLIAKEKVDSWVRAPFVEELPSGERRPKGRRLRYATGELLSCTRCMGAWSALGLVALRVARPREARVLTAVLATTALNDWMQAGFTWVCRQADEPSAATAAAGSPAASRPSPRRVA